MTPNGVHSTIERAEYDALPFEHFSTLKLMGRSPAHYKCRSVARGEQTDAQKLGSAIHLYTLEPDAVASRIETWTGGRRAGKEWEAFVKANEGKELLTKDERDLCERIAAAVRAHPIASGLLKEGRSEATIICEFAGFKIKTRLDWLGPVIADLKSTTDASPEAFGRDAFKFQYCPQAALYSDAVTQATGEVRPFYNIAVEKSAPHAVAVYRITESQIAFGRATYMQWLDKLAYCRERNYWPAYFEGEMDLQLPRWAPVEVEAADVAA